MRIAIPVSGPTLAPEYSDAPEFALYDLDNDSNAVSYAGRHPVPTPGCANSSRALQSQKVEFVIAASISQNAINHLLAVGILTAKDVAIQKPDLIIAQLVSRTLIATPPDAAMHTDKSSPCSGDPHACTRCSNQG
jgi:predicted Fe-Mo cluster-binding NifX family protein